MWRTLQNSFNTPRRQQQQKPKAAAGSSRDGNSSSFQERVQLFRADMKERSTKFKETSNERVLQMHDSWKEAQFKASERASSLRGSLNSSMSELSPMKRSIKAEVNDRRNSPETYLEPIKPGSPQEIEELKFYISEFYRTIYTRTEEIQALMKQHPDTLARHFDNLVEKTGKVSYEDFWLRYFYRCDENRVTLTWKDIIQRSRVSKIANSLAKEVEISFS